MNVKTCETLLYRTEGAVAILTLNRPRVLNAMNAAMLRELQQVLDHVESDDDVRALVLTGAGDSFCSGFDLKEQAADGNRNPMAWRETLKTKYDALTRFWRLSKPTVAAIRGHCVAGGCELAACCDISIAAENAVFGEPELKFGAGFAVMILPFLIGAKKAKELILCADDHVSAVEAERLGLVNRVTPLGEEFDQAFAVARRLSVVDPILMRLTKVALNRSFDAMGLRESMEQALDADLRIEMHGGSADRAAFMDIARDKGMKAAIEWREKRFA
ncbi:enoyl-CoA hydratase [Alphaproteobacteria bacterium]|nr:enoyl-CoA hydratase [Alphaproteobacteria bacterium]